MCEGRHDPDFSALGEVNSVEWATTYMGPQLVMLARSKERKKEVDPREHGSVFNKPKEDEVCKIAVKHKAVKVTKRGECVKMQQDELVQRSECAARKASRTKRKASRTKRDGDKGVKTIIKRKFGKNATKSEKSNRDLI